MKINPTGSQRSSLRLSIALFGIFSASSGISQQASQPTKQQTADFIRGKVLSLEPSDGRHNYSKVIAKECYLTLQFPFTADDPDGNSVKINFRKLDAGALAWDIVGTTDRNKAVELTLVSAADYGLSKFTWSQSEGDFIQNEIETYRLSFSFMKAADIPDFQKRMTEAVKYLIAQCKS